MAVIRDMMPAFELFQPATIDEAVNLLDRHGSSAWVMAGGLDTFDWLKDRTKRPAVVVDLSQIAELRGIKEVNGGLEIGAATPLTDVVRHPAVKDKFGILMEAAELVASPQIRNQGTLGGNISQDTRCCATGRAATSAMPTRRRRLTASTRFWSRTAAWR